MYTDKHYHYVCWFKLSYLQKKANGKGITRRRRHENENDAQVEAGGQAKKAEEAMMRCLDAMMILVASRRLLELIPIVEHVENTIELHLARVAQIHPHILRPGSTPATTALHQGG